MVETKTFPADVISHAVAKRLVASAVKWTKCGHIIRDCQ